MISKGRIAVICLAAAALALAGCGLTPIPDEEIIGLTGAGTAGSGGDLLALGALEGAGKGVVVSSTIVIPLVGSLTYNYTLDFFSAGSLVEQPTTDPWDEIKADGSAEIIIELPRYAANRTLDVSFDATGFNEEPSDGRVLLNGVWDAAGSATWTNPKTDTTAGYTMDLTKTWTDVSIDDPTEVFPVGYPHSGTVQIVGSVERYRDGPDGVRTGSWSGTILITFDGDSIVPVEVNGRPYLLDLATGDVTAAP